MTSHLRMLKEGLVRNGEWRIDLETELATSRKELGGEITDATECAIALTRRKLRRGQFQQMQILFGGGDCSKDPFMNGVEAAFKPCCAFSPTSQPLPVPTHIDLPANEGQYQFRRLSVAYGFAFLPTDSSIQRFPDEVDELDPHDADRQREAFGEARAELQQAFAPLADLHTASLMDSSNRPADYARLHKHFAAGKTAEERWPDQRDTWQRVCCLRERHDFFHWPLRFPAATLTALRYSLAAYGPAHEQALRQRLAESYAALDATWTPACGLHDRRPDRRDGGDRAQTCAELDVLIAHLYGLTRDEFAYILATFPVLRRKELTAFGEYQFKRKALEEFERFQSQHQPAKSK